MSCEMGGKSLGPRVDSNWSISILDSHQSREPDEREDWIPTLLNTVLVLARPSWSFELGTGP